MKPTRSLLIPGAILWAASIQYYIVQVVCAAAWANPYHFNWARNTISDLGNTACGAYGTRLVCSPLHPLMNTSFVVLGLTIIGGAYLLMTHLATDRLAKFGFVLMAWSGAGSLFVGFYPENTVSGFHIAGAAFSFIFGNLGMLILGIRLPSLPKVLRVYAMASGIIGLSALILFQMHVYLGLNLGGMERIVDYPQSIWMTVFGLYLLHSLRMQKTGSTNRSLSGGRSTS